VQLSIFKVKLGPGHQDDGQHDDPGQALTQTPLEVQRGNVAHQNFTSPMTTGFPSSVMDSQLISSFSPSQLDDPVALLPMEAQDDGIVGRKLSPIVSSLS
jgi:hypothetical protein